MSDRFGEIQLAEFLKMHQQAQTQVKASAQTQTQTQAQAQTQTQTQTQTQAKAQTQTQTQTPTQAKAQTQTQAKAISQTQAQAKAQSQAEAKAISQTQVQTKAQSQTQAQTQPQAKAQSHIQAQTQAQAKAISQLQAQTKAHSQIMAQTQAQAKAHTQAQAKAQTQVQAKTQSHAQTKIQAQAKAQSQTQVKVQSQTEAKAQTQIHAQEQIQTNRCKRPSKEGSPPVGIHDQGHGTSLAAIQLPSDCNGCDKRIQDSELDFRLGDLDDGYQKLVWILESQHSSTQHRKAVDRVTSIIVAKLGETLNPEIPDSLTNMSEFMCDRVTQELIKGKKWRQVDAVVRKYRNKNGSDKMKSFATSVDMVELVEDTSFRTVEDVKLHIIISMLSSGASIGKDDGAALVQAAISEGHFKVVAELLKRGASPSALSLAAGDTPIHAALMIGLEKDKGNFTLFDTLLNQFDSDPKTFACLDPSQVDVNGDCLFHLLAKCKVSNTALKVIETLCARKLSSSVRNLEGKLPIDYIVRKHDRRKQFLELAATAEVPQKESSFSEKGNSFNANSSKEEVVGRKIMKMVKTSTVREAQKQNIEEMIRLLDKSKLSVFHLSTSATKQEPTETTVYTISPQQSVPVKEASASTGADSEKSAQEKKIMREQDVDQAVVPEAEKEEDPGDAADRGALEAEEESEDNEEEEMEEIVIDSQVFDDLDWEIQCTVDVRKKLQDKHMSWPIKTRIIKKIQMLARGEWQPHLCKKLKNVPHKLQLYEAKVSKGGRILWDVAITFSPRCNKTAEKQQEWEDSATGGKVYSEIIRIWDIVLDHDKLHRSVQQSAERIKFHNQSLQKKFFEISSIQTPTNTEHVIPQLFPEVEYLQQQKQQKYIPTADGNEHHMTKFYSFNSALVSYVLRNIDIKADFPFCVTDKEQAIITLRSNAPILLLGRSGTGKTICCLYRMLSQFVSYWKLAAVPFLSRNIDDLKEEENPRGDTYFTDDVTVSDTDVKAKDSSNSQKAQFHQIFITKNAVLCSEVQKYFHELSHGCDIIQNHVEREADNLPSRLQDVDEFLFPLFLTSRQLLLMLDASIGAPYFFDRKEDGSLKVDIQGWSEHDVFLRRSPLSDEDCDVEEDETYADWDDDMDNNTKEASAAKASPKKLDPKREVTYKIFVDEVWPQILKKIKVSYHPSLVWTEIMSFIKGSFEALSKPCGYLSKEEYIVIGRKRAPNSTGERDIIYKYFSLYDHIKKQKNLFDETDLIHDIYKRLRNIQVLPWVIHQIFVDETQDFTQAELYLLIQICQNPNQMFLTGDTAQSIMRGISFRFEDLKAIFFQAQQSMQDKGKTEAIEVPKYVYQLTQSFRSHAGILSLASSVLDLLGEFFPESFDPLEKDQGLFNGPQPMLLESWSISDIHVLLYGNYSKTSHIEFGAHQVILVVDEAARKLVPEELRFGLILTIYEAKGLEFDDVLLYNFFKDSQASKEWRLVTSYLAKLVSSQKTSHQRTSSSTNEYLVEVDTGYIHSEHNGDAEQNYDKDCLT